ncbi:retinoid-inducible serine carboxypeptidase-like [Macrobrachium rosenbergii]|uniref:retinoid-inducible serine carboxypeptidase-like n=1 Tax=Macrobrachium rosenbergii TaxID=79674 RepID=UPI0034D4D559
MFNPPHSPRLLIRDMKWVLLWPLLVASTATVRSDPLQEEWGYVTVRPKAHMFWALYHVDQPGDYATYPLIMWLQGGPGCSGVGFGNFREMGPYDINGNKRPYAWTKSANLLFVDNPVGTGYSYVEDDSALTTDNLQIANDLVACVKEIFKANPDLEKMPFFVYAESYGGKMTVDFALAFDQAIKNGEVTSDFRGVALGDSWISPMDSINSWGPYLYMMGYVNRAGLNEVNEASAQAQAYVDAGKWTEATDAWAHAEDVIDRVAHGVNLYNVLAQEDIYMLTQRSRNEGPVDMTASMRYLYQRHVWDDFGAANDSLSDFMNGPQAQRWNIPPEVVWQQQSSKVFDTLGEDFMKPVTDSVEKLLTETQLLVAVYTGNLDLICSTPGAYQWIENMEWPGKVEWVAAENQPLHVTAYSMQAATVQRSGKFALFTLFRSGHMVPMDVPELALLMVDKITEYSNE